jgi:SAM-dependent methyltransferase
MTTVEAIRAQDGYVLGRAPEEYERLRTQARIWEPATARLFDQVALAPGARCLDAGCGPGETMRLMAERVGSTGHVTGIDLDAPLGGQALAMLHGAGHDHCTFRPVDLADDAPIAGAPFDLVYARLLLFHVTDRVALLRRLWDAVAPGGHLVIHDYDLCAVGVIPPLESMDELKRVVFGAFTGAGCDIHVGQRLPRLFARAGIGAPDGTDVAGRLEPFKAASGYFTAVYRSLLPAALALELITEERSAALLDALARDAERASDHPALWPLLIGARKRKPETESMG